MVLRSLVLSTIRKYQRLILALIAVSTLGITALVALSSSYRILEKSLAYDWEAYGHPDIFIQCDVTERSVARTLQRVNGVHQVDPRMAADIPVRLSSGRLASMSVHSMNIQDVMQFHEWEEEYVPKAIPVYVDYAFARRKDVHAGDDFTITLQGEDINVYVASLVTSPESFTMFRSSYSWGENPEYGYVYIADSYLKETEYNGKCNQFLIDLRADNTRDPEEIRLELEDILTSRGIKVYAAFTFDASPTAARVEVNLTPIRALSSTVPLFFFGVELAAMTLFIIQMIQQSRKEIGTLRALGVSKKEVTELYSSIILLVSLVSIPFGFALGVVISRFVGKTWCDTFPLPEVKYTVDYLKMLFAAISTVVVGQVASFLATASIASYSPTEALSGNSGKRVPMPKWLEKTKRLSPSVKFGVASIFRSPKRFFFAVICIAASAFLIYSSLVFQYSKSYIMEETYFYRFLHDSEVYLSERPDESVLETLLSIPGVTKAERVSYTHALLATDKGEREIPISGLERGYTLTKLISEDHVPETVDLSGIALEYSVAQDLGIQVGDKVTLNGIEATVTYITRPCVNRLSYMDLEEMEETVGVSQYSVRLASGDENTLLDEASKLKSYQYTDFKNSLKEGNEAIFATYTYGVEILIAFAVAIGFLIVYNTMGTNVLERKKEMSVLRAMGFSIRKLSGLWMAQSMLQLIMSLFLGIPLGAVFVEYVMKIMSPGDREYPRANNPLELIISIGLVILYIAISHRAVMEKIRKWNIAEEAKTKD